MTRQYKTRQDKTRQDKIKQNKTRQGQTKRDNICTRIFASFGEEEASLQYSPSKIRQEKTKYMHH